MGVLALENGFVFIHVPKTAGRSLKRVLAERGRRFREVEVLRQAALRNGGRDVGHLRAWEVREAIGAPQWSGLYSFGFVRNPWDWLVSSYSFARKEPKHPRHAEALESSFAQYLRPGQGTAAQSLMSYLSDAQGRQIVTEVFRFEQLQACWPNILERCGWVEAPPVPHINAGDRGGYRDYYTAATAELVARRFADDIARFGYTF